MNKSYILKLSDNRDLGYSEFGDPKGKPLFYFHDWPTSRLQAQPYNNVAKKLQIRIISIDRPGYGLSQFQKKQKVT